MDSDQSHQEDKEDNKKDRPVDYNIRLSPEHAYYLQRTQVLSEIQVEIETWAKKRLWILVIIVLVLGFFGIRAFVRDMIYTELKDAMKAAAIAQAASDNAHNLLQEFRGQANSYGEKIEEISVRATELDSQIIKLKSSIEAEGRYAIATAEVNVNAVEKKIKELETLVKNIANSSEQNKRSLVGYEEKLMALEQQTSETKINFLQNSDLVIGVLTPPDRPKYHQTKWEVMSKAISKNLSLAGFKVIELELRLHEGATDPSGDGVDIMLSSMDETTLDLVEQLITNTYLDMKYKVNIQTLFYKDKPAGGRADVLIGFSDP